jgi:glyoxylase-like metal-dependent hydrolase (beta-lactamase superfamily II)
MQEDIMAHSNQVELIPNQGWDERILVCRNDDLVQTFILVTAQFVVLVDTLINPETARALLDIATPYLTSRRTLLVVNTHADYDHCWGNQLFAGPQAVHPAPIIGHESSLPIFNAATTRAFWKECRQEEPAIFGDVVLTPPTLTFSGRFTIHGGDLTIEIIETPGHTPDHTALYLPEINTLLAADGAELPYPGARYPEHLPHMRASLAALAALEAETVLYCHAPVTMGPQLLADNLAYFDYLEQCCRAAKGDGLDTLPEDDAALIDQMGCSYADAVPNGPEWQTVHDYYRTTGHAAQLRAMWLSLSD